MADLSTSTAFFNSIPWTSRLLAQPNLVIAHPPSRTPKPRTREDSLIANTLKTSQTIPHCLLFHPRPASAASEITAVSALVSLGEGLNGYPSILHGGITATLIDEICGMLLQVRADRAHMAAVATGHAVGDLSPGVEAFTADLNVKFLAPVKTPGVLLLKCRVVREEGRRIVMQARVVQKEGLREELDGRLTDCAVGEAVFITPNKSRL